MMIFPSFVYLLTVLFYIKQISNSSLALKGAKSKKRVKSYFLLHCVSPSCSLIGQFTLSQKRINPRHRRYVWGCGSLSLIYHALPREPITHPLFPAFTEKHFIYQRNNYTDMKHHNFFSKINLGLFFLRYGTGQPRAIKCQLGLKHRQLIQQ